jgi:hypothetical protein
MDSIRLLGSVNSHSQLRKCSASGGQISCPQEPVAGPHRPSNAAVRISLRLILTLPCNLRLYLLLDLLFPGFPLTILYALLTPPMRAACHVLLVSISSLTSKYLTNSTNFKAYIYVTLPVLLLVPRHSSSL